jgi:hypothetical protein
MLYGTEHWAEKCHHERRISVAKKRMLHWMCENTRRDKIRNDSIRVRVGIAPIVEKMVESRLRWFGNVWGRPGDSVVRKVDLTEDNPIARGKGQRTTIEKSIKKDLVVYGLDKDMIYDRA